MCVCVFGFLFTRIDLRQFLHTNYSGITATDAAAATAAAAD